MIDDSAIISLFFSRSERALYACREKYGKYIQTILKNVLKNDEDAEECFDDVLLAAWNSIPPQKPDSLKSYLSTIARNKAIDRYSESTAAKRRGETEELLEEINDFALAETPEGEFAAKELQKEINSFLSTQDPASRACFILRYYYAMSNEEIAKKTGKNLHSIVSLLSKMRTRLKKYLTECGYEC